TLITPQKLRDLLPRPPRLTGYHLGAAQEQLTYRCGRHAMRPAFKQRSTEFALELPDIVRERRLRHAQGPRRCAQAAFLGYRQRGGELMKLHSDKFFLYSEQF